MNKWKESLVAKTDAILEYTIIKERLAALAISEEAKRELLAITPYIDAKICESKLYETSEARKLIESFGTPPIPQMYQLDEIIQLCDMDVSLTVEQLESVSKFLGSIKRMQSYLQRGEMSQINLAYYGRSFVSIDELRDQINEAIYCGKVDDRASTLLRDLRRKKEAVRNRIKERLEQILKGKKAFFTDSYVSVRNGHYVLPVKKEYKSQVPGTVVDVSGTGSTLFIEPSCVNKLEEELMVLSIQEENEIYRILFTLTSMVVEYKEDLKRNQELMIVLDVIFAKAKLSIDMNAIKPYVGYEGNVIIHEGRHPLLEVEKVVPLEFALSKENKGIVITGPNTGGKTVALKTVGLLSLMARSGLHVPAKEGTEFTMHDIVLCDIGDGQSINQNLSTFSSHIKAVIEIVDSITKDSLVLFDELGSGTDPQEGMGIAIAILEKLRSIGCYFVATTHYPEVKEYASKTEGIINASMAFDRETLSPLYQLKMNEAGESCALYIAQRLGLPEDMLQIAKEAAYRGKISSQIVSCKEKKSTRVEQIQKEVKRQEQRKQKKKKTEEFGIGDSVFVFPKKEVGIVFSVANERGEVGVQIKGKKQLISYKRLKVNIKASELYPEDYDFSILFDSVSTRKLRHKMEKRNGEGLEIHYNKDELYYKK